MRLSLVISGIALASLTVACSGGEAPKAPAAPATAAAPKSEAPATAAPAPATAAATAAASAAAGDPAAQAAEIFTQRCATCHGADGSGNGPAAAALNPKPRNYADAAWQASVTDEKLATTIVKGGAAVGLSPLMPPNPDLEAADKAPIVAEIVKKIRSFKK